MTDDNEELIDQRADDDDGALEMMEDTLKDLRGGDSYDDTDQDTDQETENDQQEESNEEEKRQDQPAKDDSEDAGEEAGEESEEEDEAGESEEVDDKLAESMNEKTAARFQHFREENKRINEEFSQVNEQFETLRTSTEAMNHYINDSQITPEQLSTSLTIAKALNTGDFKMAQAAFPRMKEMMNQIAIGIGDDSAQVQTPQELQESVDSLDITPELARRQAIMEAQRDQENAYQQQQFQQQQQQQQQFATAQQAASGIKQWEDQMVVSDPDFNAKREQILIDSEAIMKRLPPNQWLPALMDKYETISRTMESFQQINQRKAAQNQGIRPNAGTGGGSSQAAPKSFEENLKRTLDGMR